MKYINQFILFFYIFAGVFLSIEGKTNCDRLGVNFYDSIGCARQNSDDECPFYGDCKYERQLGKCLYNGAVLEDSQPIGGELDPLCNFACFCSASNNTKGKFVCAQGQCGHWGMPVPKACYIEYKLNGCCGQQRCEPSKASCTVDGKTYKEGEKFYANDECSVCICTSEFNGKYEGPHCKRRTCDSEIRFSEEIERNCAPAYYRKVPNAALCCPDTFICPSNDDKFVESQGNSSGLTCKYGDKSVKSGTSFTREVTQYGKKRTVTCECKLPPLLTCVGEY